MPEQKTQIIREPDENTIRNIQIMVIRFEILE